MVSINNNVNGFNKINSAQVLVKPKNSSATSTKNQPDGQFSTILDKKQVDNVATKKTEFPKEELSTYSPLMLRYGTKRINEIKDIAAGQGINNLTNEDFDYAIRYGRSIIADYLV